MAESVFRGVTSQILFFRGGILEETRDIGTDDLVDAARLASSSHRDLTAEIWQGGRKVAIVRPNWDQRRFGLAETDPAQ